MGIEIGTITTKVNTSEDKQHRYLISKEWNAELPKATIIMISPSEVAGAIKMDMTTLYIINNIIDLGYGSVDILNMFSKVNQEINVDMVRGEATDNDNDQCILESVDKSSITIIAWGKYSKTNKQVKIRGEQLMELLAPYNDKLYVIEDARGNSGWHPLAPSIRKGWKLKKIVSKEASNKVKSKTKTKEPKKV